MTKYIKMKHFLFNSLLTFTFFINSIEGYSQNLQENKCINDFQDLINSIKLNQGNYDGKIERFYNLFYWNYDGNVPSETHHLFPQTKSALLSI
jgi:hypothetical protein